MRDHIHTLGLFQQPGVEALREPGDDPYDFKEGDIEYTFSTSKRLKGQGREPSKKVKVGQHTQFKNTHAVLIKIHKTDLKERQYYRLHSPVTRNMAPN